MELFEKELRTLINMHYKEEDSGTADFILARFLNSCLISFAAAVSRRDVFEGRDKKPNACVPGPLNDQPRGADDQLTMCMPAELRDTVYETHPVPEDDNPPRVPWNGRLTSYKGVEGHEPECEIDLYTNWKLCTCGRG